MAFGDFTQEQREANLAAARAARIAQAAVRAANKHLLKLDYKDEGHWSELATKYKIKRMPSKEDAVTATILRKFLGKLDIAPAVFAEHYTSVAYFVKHNPTWTQYAAVGLLLELKEMQ